MNFNNSIEGKKSEAKSCSELLLEFKKKETEKGVKPKGVKLKFLGIGSKDVYNITPPFSIDGKIVIAGRVENREDEFNSEVHFFERLDEDTWVKIDNALVFNLQDPFVTTVGGEIIVGGVEVSWPPLDDKDDSVPHRTAFYKGKSLSDLERFLVGPENMKDIRIIELENGHLGVFTRPITGIYGLGKIGYIELNGLKDLTSENILKAKIIENLFVSSEWGGTSQLHLLKNGTKKGTIGVIGHIACFDEKYNKLYYGMSFDFDPFKHEASPLKIIATRDDFPVGASKRPELEKVIFLGGIDEGGIDKKFNLYAGLGDAEAGRKPIDYPF